MDEHALQTGALRRSSESWSRCSSSRRCTAASSSDGMPDLSSRSISSSAATMCCCWMALICAAGKARVIASSKVACAMACGVTLFPILSVSPGLGCVRAPSIARGSAGTFPHRPRISCTAAGRFVSSLYQGAAHAGRCVQLAVQRAVGFFLHGGSVVAHGSRSYGE